MNAHPPIKQLEYNYITDGIYIGNNQCCQTHFDEAVDFIKEKRPAIHLEKVQKEALIEFSKNITKSCCA